MPTAIPDSFRFDAKYVPQQQVLDQLIRDAALSPETRARISGRAETLVRRIRAESKPTLMEHFLAEYGLSTQEGVALMCLAEAMLRVPDADTIDALIEDKIVPSDWSRHLRAAASPLVNASTWTLMLTGRVLDDDHPGLGGVLRGAIKRLGEPVIRTAVSRAMKEMGRQFVLGETIGAALKRAEVQEAQGFTYSYDMLGEAAITATDAARYARAYADAIAAIAGRCTAEQVRDNPGISIKLSALHPRYEVAQEARVLAELVPVVRDLARQARAGGMGLNIDAEEQDRLVLSLKVIEAVLADPELAGWDGFGVVVQAYGKRAGMVIDWLYSTAKRLDRRIMVRLVKGAYWDTEMKHAQVEGLPDFTLFTNKTATDVSYIANARKLLDYADRIYPQFATHNAHTVAAILELADDQAFEFQRLHGMGERLHDIVLRETGGRCRIYAPVGAHRDLLAYLVRRLLENGANSSFVHQIVDEDVSPQDIAADPFDALAGAQPPAGLLAPSDLFGDARRNSTGWDLTDDQTLSGLTADRAAITIPDAAPLTVTAATGAPCVIRNPATGAPVATAFWAETETVLQAIADAQPWADPVTTRAETLRRAADLYEENAAAFFAVLAQEAGKTLPDAVGELREAVDFLRYYAQQAEEHDPQPRGTITAISPWNFPLAIFTGQIAAALAAGNAVLAKPAEQTPLVAAMAVRLLLQAGVPQHAIQLLPGDGPVVGAALTSDPRIDGVVFTGSTATALRIRAAMADHMDPGAPLIAETGGLNAMIVDSTALPEQAVRDICVSAFRSAGQRCSALRCLYVQEDVAPHMIGMIKGVMDELHLGDPWHLTTDVGPVIDAAARDDIVGHIDRARADGRLLHTLTAPETGTFVTPALIRVDGIADLKREVFGPVLHVATYRARDLSRVIADINATGYGLTFGLHTRIDDRVAQIAESVQAGNIYVNRNQIGAVVGSQPFGGEGLSGTGPKAGGPLYLPRFARAEPGVPGAGADGAADADTLQSRLTQAQSNHFVLEQSLFPGPTGESNTLSLSPRGPVLCLGPGAEATRQQIAAVEGLGGVAVASNGAVAPDRLTDLTGLSAVLYWGDDARPFAQALARREGPIIPLITALPDRAHVVHERHLCIDRTASGGNTTLLAGEAP
ncbi:bifunctional proline dehydrogenase/L-glutamate gamma-semialdehyde dehydrogenase PutA [Actibacterium ureilyticum]|uniref:bifunctional proline dehydrogenase/L-glutamate gamma-semialdehyde dehydrogenase PutA n=1 Tax=Actibacterium ureilyticum TaxID=1590614 RepID=UPI000BAAE38A|nr:bifunctional proline dehydrogenase/L-glutamate gamma-semialdehyde dehydrogenase PutA [Actibacterium ureilyticum]